MPYQKFGKYILLDKLTTGGMAEVYRGVVTGPSGFKRIVAIKKILPCYADSRDFMHMFIDEATIAARLNHANIAQIYDFDVVDEIPYIAMEFVEGKDLRSVLRNCAETANTIPYPIAALIALEVAKGLYYVHSRREASRPLNIVHRDVSPQNIMISRSGEVKLVDFGIAHATQRQASTSAGTVKGKYAYMSPEQVMGEVLDHRTDIFSLGVVLWEMLTLKRLFAGENDGATISNLLRRRIPLCHEVNPAVPSKLTPIVMQALARQRSDRYPSMLAFHEALSAFLFETGTYQEADKLSHFIHELFPDEMERMAQGEHLAYDPSVLPAEDADTIDARATVVEIPASETAKEDLTATEPIQAVGVRVAPGRQRAKSTATGVILAVVILGLLTVFGLQLAQKTGLGTADRGQRTEDSGQRTADRAPTVRERADVSEANVPESSDIHIASSTTPTADTAPTVSERADVGEANVPESSDIHIASSTTTSDQISFSLPPELPTANRAPTVRERADVSEASVHESSDIHIASSTPPSLPLTITVNVKPPDAKVRIDGDLYPSGKIELTDVKEGASLAIAVEKGGFNTVKDTFIAFDGLERAYELGPEGHMRIFVTPPEARVKVDGRRLKRGPGEGEYIYSGNMNQPVNIMASLNGYDTRSKSVTFRKRLDSQHISLKRASPTMDLTPTEEEEGDFGTLDINARPYAEVHVNGEYWGTTHVSRELKKGAYKIVLSHPGTGAKHTCKRKVRPGQKAKCFFDFTKQ